MRRSFVISDHHFAHDKLYSFRRPDGSLLRPWAANAAEADEMMIEAHNSIVRNQDTTYFGGDVAIKASGLKLLSRMNGRKVLIRGNHDIFRLKQYAEHFADIRGTHKIGRIILSHYPLHRRSIPKWCQANLHGHTHANDVQRRTWWGAYRPDPLYRNMSIEKIGIAPIDIEEIIASL
jgi:calcineurin-like phosphoesterase family protein